MLKTLVKHALRRYYRPGCYYRIPWGANRAFRFEYHPSMILDIMLGLHEPNSLEACRQIIRPGMTVVDLGANRGYFSLYFSRLVGPAGRVYAFEPMPDNFDALKRTIDRNGCQDIVSPQRAAAADRNARVTLYAGENHLMSSLDASWAGEAHGKISVDSVALDSFFADKDRGPDFIKMDIEGGGVYAVPGMEATIKKHRPCLLMESHTPEEDKAIGLALSWADYVVHRVGSSVEVRNIRADYQDPHGIYDTVVAVPAGSPILSRLDPPAFQRHRWGQRKSAGTR